MRPSSERLAREPRRPVELPADHLGAEPVLGDAAQPAARLVVDEEVGAVGAQQLHELADEAVEDGSSRSSPVTTAAASSRPACCSTRRRSSLEQARRVDREPGLARDRLGQRDLLVGPVAGARRGAGRRRR